MLLPDTTGREFPGDRQKDAANDYRACLLRLI
jgi:hypothetical protein